MLARNLVLVVTAIAFVASALGDRADDFWSDDDEEHSRVAQSLQGIGDSHLALQSQDAETSTYRSDQTQDDISTTSLRNAEHGLSSERNPDDAILPSDNRNPNRIEPEQSAPNPSGLAPAPAPTEKQTSGRLIPNRGALNARRVRRRSDQRRRSESERPNGEHEEERWTPKSPPASRDKSVIRAGRSRGRSSETIHSTDELVLQPGQVIRPRIIEADKAKKTSSRTTGRFAKTRERRKNARGMRGTIDFRSQLLRVQKVSRALSFVLSIHDATESETGKVLEADHVRTLTNILSDFLDVEAMMGSINYGSIGILARRASIDSDQNADPVLQDKTTLDCIQRLVDRISKILATIEPLKTATRSNFRRADPHDVSVLVFADSALNDALQLHKVSSAKDRAAPGRGMERTASLLVNIAQDLHRIRRNVQGDI